MPSLFPELFTWGFFVPTMFRVLLAAYFVSCGIRFFKDRAGTAHDKNERYAYQILGFLLLVLAGFLAFGYLVQAAAAVAVSLGIISLWIRKKNPQDAPQTRAFYIFATAMALSLIVLGPGAFAIDIPL